MVYTITFRVTGISPMLQHNPAGSMKTGGSDKISIKKIPPPEEEAQAALYRLPSGQLYGPADGLRQGIIFASSGRRIGKLGLGRLIQGAVFVIDQNVPLVRPKTREPIMDLDEICIKPVVIGKVRVLRARPQINEWSGEVTFEYDPDFLKPQWILDTFIAAGKTQGWMDYRPNRRGSYGRYTVELVHFDEKET